MLRDVVCRTMIPPSRRIGRARSMEAVRVRGERSGGRRAVGLTLACLGAVGLTIASARVLTGDALAAPAAGVCAVERIEVGYDVQYDAGLGGYRVTGASLAGVPADCAGRTLALTVEGAGAQPLAEVRAVVPVTEISFGGRVLPAQDVAGAAVTVVVDADGA